MNHSITWWQRPAACGLLIQVAPSPRESDKWLQVELHPYIVYIDLAMDLRTRRFQTTQKLVDYLVLCHGFHSGVFLTIVVSLLSSSVNFWSCNGDLSKSLKRSSSIKNIYNCIEASSYKSTALSERSSNKMSWTSEWTLVPKIIKQCELGRWPEVERRQWSPGTGRGFKCCWFGCQVVRQEVVQHVVMDWEDSVSVVQLADSWLFYTSLAFCNAHQMNETYIVVARHLVWSRLNWAWW